MTIDLTKLTTDVTALEATVTANSTLLQDLTTEIKVLSGSTTDPVTQAALDLLAGRIEAATGAVVAADTANPATPAA